MEQAVLDRCRQRLLEQREELESLVAASTSASDPVALDQTSVGRLSRMDAIQMQQMALEAKSRRKAQLANIRIALQLMASGDYGFCERCGDEIDIRRLEFDPSSLFCVSCAD